MKAEIPKASKSELRKFAFIMAGMISLFIGIIVPWIWGLGFLLWVWVTAGVFAIWGLVWPAGLQPVYRGWMRFGLVVGWINARIILGIVFYLLFTPLGLGLRLLGKDPMRRKLDDDTSSYRIKSQDAPPEHLERPY